MKITEVEVGYAETVSLPGYNNVRPSVRLVAQVGKSQNGAEKFLDEDPLMVIHNLRNQAREIVEDEVDEALTRVGKAPKYFDGPRYQVMKEIRDLKVIAIFPNDLDWDTLDGEWYHVFSDMDVRGLALKQARDLAQRFAGSLKVVDCSDGDLSRLPKIEEKKEEEDAEEKADQDEEVPF